MLLLRFTRFGEVEADLSLIFSVKLLDIGGGINHNILLFESFGIKNTRPNREKAFRLLRIDARCIRLAAFRLGGW